MPDYPNIEFNSAEEFRNWLEQNHNVCKGVRLVFYKKHTGKRTFSYPQALDEALCFGWIDSTLRSIDDEKYCQNFTPRTNISNWSEVNKLKVLKLIENGKMTPAGLNKIDVYIKSGKLDWKHENIRKGPEPVPELPQYFKIILVENQLAFENFQKLAASHKKTYLNWIIAAKREETQLKRVTRVLEMLARNEKPGIL
jgi:uncharacterized protein YdeI (YjbR/CyaY-like superfamily)